MPYKDGAIAMNNMRKITNVIKILKREYPKAKISLNFSNRMELLVATILSAQCTDQRVNIITKDLFNEYKTIADYANAKIKVFEQDIRSAGFFRNKAKNIIGAAKMIEEKYKGEIPQKMEDLLKLPGVARKTANIVLFNAFNKQQGIAVDTHVKRLCNRIGFSDNTDQQNIERDLMKIIPPKEWGNFTNLLIAHGRNVCRARKPLCSKCCTKGYCEFVKQMEKEDRP